MYLWLFLKRPPWRTVVPGAGLCLTIWLGYLAWTPGLDARDGRHDHFLNQVESTR